MIRALVILTVCAALACALSLAIGSVTIAPSDLWQVVIGQGDTLNRTLLIDLRLPRTLSAFAAGGLLAIAGALMQVLLRNPLADPYVLGLSGGAATGALLAMLAGAGMLLVSRLPWLAVVVLVTAIIVLIPLARSLNVLARGPLQAAALGVSVRPLEWTIYLLASLLTATAVTSVGSIGFVGLIVPHMLRLVLGNDQRIILPASALAGGTLLVLADTLARTVIAPEQLPVGVITALLGVPTFLYLLHRSR